MRVRQLSKKLDITPSRLEKYLVSNFDLDDATNPNLKLEDEIVDKVINHFGLPEKKEEVVVKKSKPVSIESSNKEEGKDLDKKEGDTTDPEEKEPVEEFENVEVQNNTVDEVKKEEKPKTEIVHTDETTLHIEEGVIKAPKVDLPGIKVKGKIDLPEPKAKEEKIQDEDAENSQPEKENTKSEEKIIPEFNPKPRPKRNKKKQETNKRPTKKEPTLQEIKEKENKELEAKLAKKKQKEAEAKKAHYFEEVQPKILKNKKKKGKKKKKNQESIADNHSKSKSTIKKEKPKTAWGKFIYWLNS